jgi:hypothetical protein
MLQVCHTLSPQIEAGRGAQILIPLYFVRYLTLNSFSVLRPTECLGKTRVRERELPSNALGGFRLPSAVGNSIRELGKPGG